MELKEDFRNLLDLDIKEIESKITSAGTRILALNETAKDMLMKQSYGKQVLIIEANINCTQVWIWDGLQPVQAKEDSDFTY